MIISAGSTVFRAFSESLSDQLQQDFTSRNIQSDFLYIGNRSKIINHNFSDVIKRQDFDALMVIIQTDTSRVTTSNRFTFSYRDRLKQKFEILVFDSNSYDDPVWRAAVKSGADFSKGFSYRYLSHQVLVQMAKNKLL